jgi:hypothetical protein
VATSLLRITGSMALGQRSRGRKGKSLKISLVYNTRHHVLLFTKMGCKMRRKEDFLAKLI